MRTFILASAFLAACAPLTSTTTGDPVTCDANAASYAPLSTGNGASIQDLLDAHHEIHELRETETFAKADFTHIQSVYTSRLQSFVKGITVSPSWEVANAGNALDATIVAAINRGMDAQDTSDIAVLGQLVDKTLFRAMYLGMWQEMRRSDDKQAGWDSAFKLYGRSNDGAASESVSGEVAEYDEIAGIHKNEDAFKAFIRGRCALIEGHDANLTGAAGDVEEAVRIGLAHAAGHYFQRVYLGMADASDFAEGAAWYNAVEPWMKANGFSSEAATVRTWVDAHLPGGAMADVTPDEAGARNAVELLRNAYNLAI